LTFIDISLSLLSMNVDLYREASDA